MKSVVGALPLLGAGGLLFAVALYRNVLRRDAGTARMREIAAEIHDGAMAFLKLENTILAFFTVAVGALLALLLDPRTALAFACGASCSILAGFFGMKAATRAGVRTAAAARERGSAEALLVAFNGGAVMGVVVASLGLIGVGFLFRLFDKPETSGVINGFAMGASSIALFAR